MKLQEFDSSYFRDKIPFKDDSTKNYLEFQPVLKYFKKIANSDNISAWKSKELSDKRIKPHATSNNSLAPSLNYNYNKVTVKLDGSCLKQEKVTFKHK